MSFKVIIAGGGPAGLVAAHALHLAGIDFVVLERRDSVIDASGASVVLSPPSMRILSQFGLREKLEAAGAELEHVKSFTREGYKFRDSTQITLLKEWFVNSVLSWRPKKLICDFQSRCRTGDLSST
jgi:2-polyprenyl-6-methoxyphenol hydroxylase-like FAD-dependent oxidoreductase